MSRGGRPRGQSSLSSSKKCFKAFLSMFYYNFISIYDKLNYTPSTRNLLPLPPRRGVLLYGSSTSYSTETLPCTPRTVAVEGILLENHGSGYLAVLWNFVCCSHLCCWCTTDWPSLLRKHRS